MLSAPSLPGPRVQAAWLLDDHSGAAQHTVTLCNTWLYSPSVLWVCRKSSCFSNLQLLKQHKSSLFTTSRRTMRHKLPLSFVLLWNFHGSCLMASLFSHCCSQILAYLIRHGIKSNNHAHGNTPPFLCLRWLVFHQHYYVNSKNHLQLPMN